MNAPYLKRLAMEIHRLSALPASVQGTRAELIWQQRCAEINSGSEIGENW